MQHGRLTSIDPLTASANVKDPQTFNRYSYVLNSPYKFVDPLGLIAQSAGTNENEVDQDCSCPKKPKKPKKPVQTRRRPPPAPKRNVSSQVNIQNNQTNIQNTTTVNVQNNNSSSESEESETIIADGTATINEDFIKAKSSEVAKSLNETFFKEQNIVQKASNNKEASALKAISKEIADTFDPQVQVSGNVSVGTDTSVQGGGSVQINLPSPAAVLSALGDEAINVRRDVANNRIEGTNAVNLILANAAVDMSARGVTRNEITPALSHIVAVGIATHQEAVQNAPRIKRIP